jgi:hypothetical protein
MHRAGIVINMVDDFVETSCAVLTPPFPPFFPILSFAGWGEAPYIGPHGTLVFGQPALPYNLLPMD